MIKVKMSNCLNQDSYEYTNKIDSLILIIQFDWRKFLFANMPQNSIEYFDFKLRNIENIPND